MHVRGVPEEEEGADAPTLVSAPDAGTADLQRVPGTLYIGDLKLSRLKSALSREHQMRSDFAGEGVLVCSDFGGSEQPRRNVTVTKEGNGRIVIEGNLGMGLSVVRDSVQALYAQVDK